MFVLFFLFWVMLNGRITVEITIWSGYLSSDVRICMQNSQASVSKRYADSEKAAVDRCLLSGAGE